jgi:peptidyl-prolyl cis-trans isomerase B (cyclophilin B)
VHRRKVGSLGIKLVVLLLYAALLGGGWQGTPADEDTLRAIEIDEFHRTLDPVLVSSLDATPAIAARAALAIGRTKQPQGAAPLRAHLSTSDPSVRAMVVYGLGLLRDGASLQNVSRLAQSDSNSAVRYAAVDALGRIAASDATLATPALADNLIGIARADADPVIRAHAAAQLDPFRKSPEAPRIAAALEAIESHDTDSAVRWHAAWMLFRGYATFANLSFLKNAAHDPEELVRVETARALGHRKELAAIGIARAMMNDRSWHVQLEAGEAVRRLLLEPPTAHLKAFPPGVRLPAIPMAEPPAKNNLIRCTGVPLGRTPERAPDPQQFDLGASLLPKTARDMNGPAPGAHPRVELRTTKGVVVVRLYPEWAPSTVANFLGLVATHNVDDNRWFRIVPDFVVQTGDVANTGDGDPGYTIPAEENPVEQRTGIIAMGLNYDANGAVRDSAGTQFYLTLSPQLHLDRSFSVFGEVESGFGVLANLLENDYIESATRLPDK